MHYKFLPAFAFAILIFMPPAVSYGQLPILAVDSTKYVYSDVDETPSFEGNLISFIANNLQYPDSSKIDDLDGKVSVQFIVNIDGTLEDIKTYRPSGSVAWDKELIRVVKLMPKWRPAKWNGFAVRAYFMLPVTLCFY